MSTPEHYIGIMSGTSLDGIDAVLVAFDEHGQQQLASHYQPYPDRLKHELLALHSPSHDELHRAQLTALQLARAYAKATQDLLRQAGFDAARVTAIGCHGQTIRHRPEHGYTLQLNQPALLAELTGIPVVSDFRSRDLAAGGQGAPLVPAFHDRMLRHPTQHRVILNIGGIANLTDLAPGKDTTGFDSGPGNLLLDAWIARHQGKAYDADGAWATSGHTIQPLLQRLLAEPFFAFAPPKSTGRDLFNLDWLDTHLLGDEAPADVQATLLALSTESIAAALQRFCPGAQELYLCGGGAHNQALVHSLAQRLPQLHIAPTDTLGIAADWMEAVAFAWLAHQAIHGQPGNLPAVTGAHHARVLGTINPA
ncbi:MAG: anhydro-N-acetylmuramic acid kinase [Pseudomonadota bacterium]